MSSSCGFFIILFPDGVFSDGVFPGENWNGVDDEASEVVPRPSDGSEKELRAVDGWHEFEPNVLEDNPELVTIGKWKLNEVDVAGAVVGTKEFDKNGVKDAPVDVLLVVPNL